MKSSVTIEEVALKADARGLVYEPVNLSQLAGQRNAHVVVTVPGGIRGNHGHQRSSEITVIHGPALVRLREGQTVRDVQVPAGKAYRFIIPPGVGHAFKNTGTEPMLLVAFNSEVFDPAKPDSTREELITT
jgi:dTDP-4-dehydrorhamnose 3,5-epimerase-like enzyme